MRRTVGAAIVGFLGMALVVLGASLPSSPFTSKLPGAWIFGIPAPGSAPGPHELVGMAVVYGGMIVLLGAWYRLVIFPVPHGPPPLRHLSGVLVLWVVPLVVAPPLFSRDVYTYGAEGELVSGGVNPYAHGLQSVRGSTFYQLADPLWRHAHAPYGPFFFDIARANAHVSGSVFGVLEGYRLVALLGVVLIAVSVPALARSYGRDGAGAFALAVLNPLVLVSLVGAMHNDALMLGLLVAGVALARRGHPVLGIVLCALGAEVKVPALLGVLFIGWEWAGAGALGRRRARAVMGSVAVAGVVMAAVSEASGLGWAWLWNLSDPGKVNSWLDPATAVGLALAHVVHGVGAGMHTPGLVMAARAVALLAAAVIVGALLTRTDRVGVPRALGWSLLAVVFLGPVVWPWYETWGIVILALASDAWSRRVVLVLSSVACFATVPAHVTATAADVVATVVGLLVVVGGTAWWLRTVHDAAVALPVDGA
ncbi:MAG TPA: polyprenol phosphomannose-dependent alpha 1,6 mannosyltransferase MptB [Acidimicrobiales bacterium]